MKERRENAIASKNFGPVVKGKLYTLIYEAGVDSDGEQNVAVTDSQTGEYLCRMRESSFSLLCEEF